MKTLITLFALAALASPAHAITDYQCVNDCTQRGYLYSVCVSQCSTDDDRRQPGPHQTDYQCVNDCTSQGYLYSVCVDRCSN